MVSSWMKRIQILFTKFSPLSEHNIYYILIQYYELKMYFSFKKKFLKFPQLKYGKLFLGYLDWTSHNFDSCQKIKETVNREKHIFKHFRYLIYIVNIFIIFVSEEYNLRHISGFYGLIQIKLTHWHMCRYYKTKRSASLRYFDICFMHSIGVVFDRR